MSVVSWPPHKDRNLIIRILGLCCLISFMVPTIGLKAQALPEGIDLIESVITEGKSLFDQDKFEDAKTFFEKAVRVKGRSGEARYWLGVTCFELRDYREAAKQLRLAIRHDRRNPEGHLALGRTYMRMKNRMVDARKSFKEALRYDPRNSEAHYTLGLAYIAQSKRDPAAPLYVYQARKSFNQAAVSNPLHPDAYYQLGLSYENPSRDYKKALALISRQLYITPGHQEALYHLEKCSYLLKQYEVGITFLKQLVTAHGNNVPGSVHTLINKLEATMLQSQNRFAEADTAYEKFLAELEPKELEYYMDLAYVAPEKEYQYFSTIRSKELKADYRRKFWAARDPQPATPVNERLVEHYRRVMHAREYYANGKQPWDRRGDIYVRYGEPDDQQHFIMQTGENPMKYYQPTGNARIDAIRERNFMLQYRLKIDNSGAVWRDKGKRQTIDPDAGNYLPELSMRGNSITEWTERAQSLGYVAESWVYLEHDMELFFVDQLGVGKFDFPLGVHETNITEAFIQNEYNPGRIANTLIRKVSESYDYNYGGEPLKYLYDIVSYKGDGDRADIEIAYMVPAVQLDTIEDGRGKHTWFNSHVVFQDVDYHRIAQVSKRIGPLERPIKSDSKDDPVLKLYTGLLGMDSPPGKFRAAIEVRDEVTGRIGIFEQEYTVPAYSGDQLTMSDIKLAVSISPAENDTTNFVRNGLLIEPNPAHLYHRTDPVHFYYEIYNLKQDPSGRTAYQVEMEVKNINRNPQNIFWRIIKGIDRLVKRTDGENAVLMVFENEGDRNDEYSYTSIDTGSSTTGAYLLTIRVTDKHSGQITMRNKEFVVTNDISRGGSTAD